MIYTVLINAILKKKEEKKSKIERKINQETKALFVLIV